jgi:hypothetical protein
VGVVHGSWLKAALFQDLHDPSVVVLLVEGRVFALNVERDE